MDQLKLDSLLTSFYKVFGLVVLKFKNNLSDGNISEGNTAKCIITSEDNVFGNDKIEQLKFFNVAYQIGSREWVSGHKTGEYKKKIVFVGEIDTEDSPIALPDLIGCKYGQPILVTDDTQFSIGFSGFRGFNDVGIVQKAF